MKSYTIINKRDDAVIVKEGLTLLEISAQIDTDTVSFRKEWRGENIEYHARLLTSEDDTLARWVQWSNYISQDAYNDAVRQLDRNLREVKRYIRIGKKHPAYKKMSQIVNEKVSSFKADFTYNDTLNMGKNENMGHYDSFVWVIRSSGTWTLRENDIFSNMVLDYNEKQEFYIVNETVTPCTKEQARHFLAWKE